MSNHKILYLNQEDVSNLLTIEETLEVVEEAFRQDGLGTVQMPPKTYLDFSKGDLRIMPSSMENLDVAGTKIVNVHPENFKEELPTVMATMILNDKETGRPLAFMDAGLITDYRTGAAGAVAAKYLSREDSEVVGLVGLGNQARTQLRALMLVRDIKTVKIYDRDSKTQSDFAYWVEKELGLEVFWRSISDVCDCDILVTTTPVRKPIIKTKWIKDDTHINAIGADAKGKQELENLIINRALIVVDNWEQASHSGEINIPVSIGILPEWRIYSTLGKIVCGKSLKREVKSLITVFDSTGLAIQDLSTAALVYRKAIEQGVGLKLDLF